VQSLLASWARPRPQASRLRERFVGELFLSHCLHKFHILLRSVDVFVFENKPILQTANRKGLPTPDLVLKAVKTVALRRRGKSARHYATHKRARNGLGKSDDLHAGKMLIRKLIKAFTMAPSNRALSPVLPGCRTFASANLRHFYDGLPCERRFWGSAGWVGS